MVDAVVSFTVRRLGDALIQEAISLRGVRDEVKWLRNKLNWMLCFLKDAEEKQDGDHRIRKWVSDIRDVAYDAEDIIDKFILKVEKGGLWKKVGLKACLEMYFCIYRQANLYGIGKEIKELQNRLEEIQRNQENFKIENIGAIEGGPSRMNERLKQLRRESPYEDDIHVGFKEDADLLMSELLKEVPHRRVLTIVGMGGLGKTTLARKLYNSSKYDCCAWVSVSKEYNIKDLLQKTIKSFEIPTSKEQWEMMDVVEDLERHLRKYLNGRRYLVVLDDVWEKEAWASLRKAFPDNKNKSRLIITTRIKDVAEGFGEAAYVHELPFLKKNESWELFCMKAFPGYNCPPSLEQLARDMVSKCRGLPLAIVVLGGLLSRKHPDEWPKVRKHIWRHVRDDDSAHVHQILALSFNDLPHHLKSCFLYIGLVPEDFEVEADKLLRLWVAEGFIQPGNGLAVDEVDDLEDLALEYLNQLIDRNLIQVAERSWRRIVSCRVHDLLRDLAIQKSEELNFLQIYDGIIYKAVSPNSRRLASHCGFERFVSFDHSGSHLRTLLFFPVENEWARPAQLEVLYKKLRLLRVLDLEGITLIPSRETGKRRLPDQIGKLIHLRYLGLSNRCELPPCIGNLQALQTLWMDDETDLPEEICNAKQLRHLIGRLNWPFPVNNLKNLRTLRKVIVDEQMEFNPMDLINLRELHVYFCGKGNRFTLHSICRLRSLQTLCLRVSMSCDWYPFQHLLQLRLRGIINSCQISNLPTEMHKLMPNLKYLWLDGSRIEEDPMLALEKLPKLTILDLDSYSGNKLACTATGFPQLEILQLIRCRSLEELQVDEGGMPVLGGLRFVEHAPIPIKITERLKFIPVPKNWGVPSVDDLWPY